jgi:hypothetical protein
MEQETPVPERLDLSTYLGRIKAELLQVQRILTDKK